MPPVSTVITGGDTRFTSSSTTCASRTRPSASATISTTAAGTFRAAAISINYMGGPDMAPQTPQRSSRPGAAGALLYSTGAPTWPPNPRTLLTPRRSRGARLFDVGAPTWPPNPPKGSSRPGGAGALVDHPLFEEREVDDAVHGDGLLDPAHLDEEVLK